tara:strand:- start:636 stop:1202 length:567 start_codon:yes stop_codon:yes gene_type:complete
MRKTPKGKSIRRQENGRRAIQIFNTQMRSRFPLCGAKAKSTGLPCRRFAMENGRCDNHGGKTPKGDGWHRPVWPNKSAPDAIRKMYGKIAALEKSARKRAARLARMTEEQRRRHENWHRERPVTTASDRAEQRRLRHDAKSARESFSSEPPSALSEDPEYRVLVARIAELKANLAAMEKEEIEKGVFG